MEQFYTKQISKEIFEALLNKKYPAENIPVGYFVFKEGGGYPEYAQKIPTYAEVLDWLADKDLFISIDKVSENDTFWAYNRKRATSIHATNLNFHKALDEAILLAVEFLKFEKDNDL